MSPVATAVPDLYRAFAPALDGFASIGHNVDIICMTIRFYTTQLVVLFIAVAACGHLRAADWPMWGGNASRNMVSTERGLPDTFTAAESSATESAPSTQPAAGNVNLKWVATVG